VSRNPVCEILATNMSREICLPPMPENITVRDSSPNEDEPCSGQHISHFLLTEGLVVEKANRQINSRKCGSFGVSLLRCVFWCLKIWREHTNFVYIPDSMGRALPMIPNYSLDEDWLRSVSIEEKYPHRGNREVSPQLSPGIFLSSPIQQDRGENQQESESRNRNRSFRNHLFPSACTLFSFFMVLLPGVALLIATVGRQILLGILLVVDWEVLFLSHWGWSWCG
jgi:hypothetical protein